MIQEEFRDSRQSAITAISTVLTDNIGGTTNSGPHAWRCEYPDRYGACNCIEELAADIVVALDGCEI